MVNKERVILMTKLASYELGPGNKNIAIGSFFRADYIGFQLLHSIISITIATVIVIGVYVLYNFEELMLEIYHMDLIEIGNEILRYYLIVLGAYCALTYVVYSYRYHRARKALRNYSHNLRKLSQIKDSP